MLSSGPVPNGEARYVPAESGGGEAFTRGSTLLPAPPHRERQIAVAR